MNSLLMAANEQFSNELAQFALDPELLELISGGGVPCKFCADVTSVTKDGITHDTVDCMACPS